MIGQREALRLVGCEAFDPQGHRIGVVGQIFLDDSTEEPAWIGVETGLFGTNESFVPLDGAAFDGDTVTVAVSKEMVRNAPAVLLDHGDLALEHVRALYLHYGREHDVSMPADMAARYPIEPTPEYVEAVRLTLRRWAAAT